MTTDFGRWLKGQLDRREWGVTRFAREAGFSHGLVSQWLSGARNPSPRSIDKIADVLFADVDELLTIAGHRPRGLDDIDPDAPGEQIAAMARRVEWTPDRYETARAMFVSWIERDRRQG